MITKEGFQSWVSEQIRDTDLSLDQVKEIRFTVESVWKGPKVCAEIIAYCHNESGKKYIVGDDFATEVHIVPIKSLT